MFERITLLFKKKSPIPMPELHIAVAGKPLMSDSLICPYCASKNFVKRGWRTKKLEKVQLLLCRDCHKTFTPHQTKGKHYPLSVMLDAVSIYNLGYSLEVTCQIVNQRNSKMDAGGSEFPRVTEQTSFVSEVSGGASSDPSRGINHAPASTLDGDRLSTNILSPTDSSATPASAYQSNSKSANLSSNKKEALIAESFSRAGSNVPASDTRNWKIPLYGTFVKWSKTWRKAGGTIPSPFGPKRVSDALPPCGIHLPTTKNIVSQIGIQPSTLSNWLLETAQLCKFNRMREFAMKKYSPKDMVIHATLAHQQLYHYRFHRGKCDLMIREEYQHRKFQPLADFLEMVPVECPHQYFQQGLRASEAPLAFSKKQMIVRAKSNFANKLCTFVLQSVKERKDRHEALEKFMLANDSVTVATEIPVYITRDDIEHMKTQLGFEIFSRVIASEATKLSSQPNNEIAAATSWPRNDNNNSPAAEIDRDLLVKSLPKTPPPIGGVGIADIAEELPKLITGHIDILQIRNGMVHILDFKPNAEKERPIEQLTLYAMALSRLTGLRLFEFKCAWFDEKDYFEFYPLHVLHKPKKTSRRRKIATGEGVYKVNYNPERFEYIRPVATL